MTKYFNILNTSKIIKCGSWRNEFTKSSKPPRRLWRVYSVYNIYILDRVYIFIDLNINHIHKSIYSKINRRKHRINITHTHVSSSPPPHTHIYIYIYSIIYSILYSIVNIQVWSFTLGMCGYLTRDVYFWRGFNFESRSKSWMSQLSSWSENYTIDSVLHKEQWY